MTILGKHTQRELSELVNNFDGFVAAMQHTIDTGGLDSWQLAAPLDANAWRADWARFLARYHPAAAAARAAVGTTLAWDVLTAEPEYQALVVAFKPSDGAPTSFDELDRRLRVANAQAPDYAPTQPTAPDADLGAYKAADAGLQALGSLAQAAKASLPSPTNPWVLLGTGAVVLILIGALRR